MLANSVGRFSHNPFLTYASFYFMLFFEPFILDFIHHNTQLPMRTNRIAPTIIASCGRNEPGGVVLV